MFAARCSISPPRASSSMPRSERLTLAEQEVSQARDRFNAGVAGNADVVNASLALTRSRTLVNDAETGYQLARVSLARATGSVTTLR